MSCGDTPPAGVEDLMLEAPADFHARHGFVKMVAPVHLPSSRADTDQVEVWLRVPDGAEIGVRPGPDGPSLDFPVGTVADRVEFVGLGTQRRVADVRGAEIVDGGDQLFHVYRPTARTPDTPLFGISWRRSDDVAHDRATDRLVAKLEHLHPIADEARRAVFAGDVRDKNACLPCHEPARPENVRQNEHGLVNRGTDHSGFFTPATTLRDELPLEAYGAHDLSLRDPAIEVVCPDGDEFDGRRCPNGRVPRGAWSWTRAWHHDWERAREICDARRYLVEHMSPSGQAIFEESLAPCNR